VDLELIKRKQKFLGLDNLELYKGDFAKTFQFQELQGLNFSLAFIDCDLFNGYIESLNYVWPKLLPNGIIFLDEYYSLKFPGPRLAVQEFLQKLNIDSFQLRMISNPEDDFERWIIKKL
jgi:predicted O-methyltransferase YrrM